MTRLLPPPGRARLTTVGVLSRVRGHHPGASTSLARTAAAVTVLSTLMLGCTSTATTKAATTTTPVPTTSLSSPPVVRSLTPPRATAGEVSRLVFPGRRGGVEGAVGAALTRRSYSLEAACTSPSPQRTLTVSLLDAEGRTSLTNEQRVLATSPIRCDGQPNVTTYDGVLPFTPVQISAGQTDDITSLYAVLRPNP